MNSITKKWLRGSLLTTLLVLLLAEGLFLFQSYNLYYGGVRQAVNSRFASISGQLKMYTGDEKATQSQRRSQALRRMVEQFDEKDKFEFTLLDAGGQVLASSSGRAGELSSLEDFQQAMASPDGRGEAIYRSVAGERVLAITILTPYQAEDIAEIVAFLGGRGTEDSELLRDMARSTIRMVSGSVDAYVKRDVPLAEKVITEDDVVDDYFARVKKALISRIAADPADGEFALDVLMIAKYFERIGDHAVNIAEWVIFSVTGEHKEG